MSTEEGTPSHTATLPHSATATYSYDEHSDERLIPLWQLAFKNQKKVVKVDQAMKEFLRSIRDVLFHKFEAEGFGVGMHHWKVNRWVKEVELFLKKILGHTLPIN